MPNYNRLEMAKRQEYYRKGESGWQEAFEAAKKEKFKFPLRDSPWKGFNSAIGRDLYFKADQHADYYGGWFGGGGKRVLGAPSKEKRQRMTLVFNRAYRRAKKAFLRYKRTLAWGGHGMAALFEAGEANREMVIKLDISTGEHNSLPFEKNYLRVSEPGAARRRPWRQTLTGT